ncbi:TorF family putative porin [uncultured Thiohalocapsa sp.]|uniref:TorF family putative porin n=1 Tax=uncultured Thiohalocapsa sp. TaxID=768990 RepID=UPI0025F5F219|nr:TorF family putative porin [uncultured Thiohalocapsa sp.]
MTTLMIRNAAAGTLAVVSLASMSTALAQDPWSFSANIGAVSNYMWRGVTQTGDQAAVQGGLDVAHESGFYAGTWASNIDWDEGSSEEVMGIVPVDPDTGMPMTDADGNYIVQGTTAGADDDSPNYELDFYAGYGFAVNDDLSFDFSTIYYAYPDGRDADFWEIGASGTYRWFTAGLAYTAWGEADDDGPFSEGDLYYYGSVDVPLPYDFGLSLFGGYYDFDTKDIGGVDYGHGGVSISKEAGDFGTFSFNYEQVGRDTYDDDPKFWVGWLKEF